MLKMVFLYLLTFSLTSQALVGGDDLVTSSGPDSICRIVLSDSKGFSICSGSLIKSDQILTAAHCVENLSLDTKIKVSCGYQGFDPNKLIAERSVSDNTAYIQGPQFKEEALATSYKIHPLRKKSPEDFDIALLSLDHSLSITPLKVIESIPKRQSLSCWSAGYGINKNINMGFLQVGKIDSKSLQNNSFKFIDSNFKSILTDPSDPDNLLLEVPTILKYADRSTMTTSVVVFGDSGGPVYCQNQDHGDFFQVAINRAVYYSRSQEAKTEIFDISYTSAFSKVNLEF